MQRLGPVIVAGGSIAVVTSSVDVQGLPMVGAYAASKAALRSMSDRPRGSSWQGRSA